MVPGSGLTRGQPRRGTLLRVVVLAAALVVAGCASSATPNRPARAADGGCHGVRFQDVRGPRPAYVHGPLQSYAADPAVCAAYWLPRAGRLFVPQSLEIRGRTAYVAGYRWHRTGRDQPCQLAVVDTRTGRTLAFVRRWQASVYRPEPTFCRHAGGMELIEDGLLVLETQRLWLLDPDRLGKSDPVLRVWRIPKPVRGSTLVVSGDELGVASYRRHRPGRIWWFRLDRALRPGVRVLDRPDREGRVPTALQGVAPGPGGLWFSSSTTHCGELAGPGRHTPLAFVPGAEDLEFRGADLWTVSEAGARPYLDPDEAVVPMLLRLDRRAVHAGSSPAPCG